MRIHHSAFFTVLATVTLLISSLQGITQEECIRTIIGQCGTLTHQEKISLTLTVKKHWKSTGEHDLKGRGLRAVIVGVAMELEFCSGLTVDAFCRRFLAQVRGPQDLLAAKKPSPCPPRYQEECCGVCLDTLAKSTGEISLWCSHIFHERCLIRLLATNPQSSCPCCRGELTDGMRITIRSRHPRLYAAAVLAARQQRRRDEEAEWRAVQEIFGDALSLRSPGHE